MHTPTFTTSTSCAACGKPAAATSTQARILGKKTRPATGWAYCNACDAFTRIRDGALARIATPTSSAAPTSPAPPRPAATIAAASSSTASTPLEELHDWIWRNVSVGDAWQDVLTRARAAGILSRDLADVDRRVRAHKREKRTREESLDLIYRRITGRPFHSRAIAPAATRGA